jgi:hypothetical protein
MRQIPNVGRGLGERWASVGRTRVTAFVLFCAAGVDVRVAADHQGQEARGVVLTAGSPQPHPTGTHFGAHRRGHRHGRGGGGVNGDGHPGRGAQHHQPPLVRPVVTGRPEGGVDHPAQEQQTRTLILVIGVEALTRVVVDRALVQDGEVGLLGPGGRGPEPRADRCRGWGWTPPIRPASSPSSAEPTARGRRSRGPERISLLRRRPDCRTRRAW